MTGPDWNTISDTAALKAKKAKYSCNFSWIEEHVLGNQLFHFAHR